MNKHNLIKLGALSQKKFAMKDNFTIMEVPASTVYSVAVHNELSFHGDISRAPFDRDDVILEKFGSSDNYEHIRVGYSSRANVLLISDAT